ncbi:MAG: tetratricopeptide repeat protein [Candidatus Nealsonbacteria bacterium]|nr:tetratricopeptide repeat protein [Candidatus Nealsonbacteria bacterium]
MKLQQLASLVYAAAVVTSLVSLLVLPLCGAEPEEPDAAEEAYDRAIDWLEKADFEKALAAFSEAIRLDPKFTEAYVSRGWVYQEVGELGKAVADYDRAIQLDADNAEAFCNRGNVYSETGETKKALADLAEAIRLDPKLIEAYLVRGWLYSETDQLEKAVSDYTQALGLEPANPFARYGRALCYNATGEFDEAITDLDAAIEQEPEVAEFYGIRGVAHLHKRAYDAGVADLEKAIHLNPDDTGAVYQPQGTRELSDEALEHGRTQLRRMLQDRPAMATHGEDAGVLGAWAVRKFAGGDLSLLIDWDPELPTHSEAEHVAPMRGRRARIRVHPKYLDEPDEEKDRPFEELWSNAVYELHNLGFARDFVELHNDAFAGEVSKEEFVAGILQLEHLAAQQTRAFYARVYLPWAKEQKLATDPSLWFADWWETAEEALADFDDPTLYPWKPYARQYDWATVRREFRDEKHAPALKLLLEMAGDKEYAEEQARVHVWIAHCRLKLGETDAALKAFTESLRLEPDNVNVYHDRAVAYEIKGELDKALDDLNEMVRLTPDDPDAYLARARIYEKQDEKAKAEADLAKAKELKAAEENPTTPEKNGAEKE